MDKNLKQILNYMENRDAYSPEERKLIRKSLLEITNKSLKKFNININRLFDSINSADVSEDEKEQ